MAPRFGKALLGAAAGQAFDEATGSSWGKVLGGGLGLNVFTSPFVKKAIGNILQSPRVQRAVLLKLAPMFEMAAGAV
ncbi:hypothetical protein P9228_30925, partial [Mesorhizobium sp. WSM4898]|uniref:hypothetical protein n=1 Tax=Mesorhizobium sp. WSM4898 TaxID=3038544 RepID=UPI002414E482